jgi:hypothetical protein
LRCPEKIKLLQRNDAQALALAALDMRANYAFNMQHFLFNRQFLTRMRKLGPFFQGPFPDFYAANISMLVADRIGLLAEPMVIIGISPKSYGYHHFNNTEKEGISFLNATSQVDQTNDFIAMQLLPGTNMNSSWLVSVALIGKRLGAGNDLQPNVGRYRRLQIKYNLKRIASGEPADADLRKLWPSLTWKERLFALALKAFLLPSRVLGGRLRGRWVRFAEIFVPQYPPLPAGLPKSVLGRYQTIVDVYAGLAGKDVLSMRGAVDGAQSMSSQ